ncbi:pentatricopeptide repeat-containing protein At3g13880-like [Zingiber officinale]|uniref:pentatricopeptide repeat-containing protein At3g13880-like n=1 Tax=Zingiber officinale TaxID=94328 RepID=UPI001C4CEF37|nr:pentatricopeptide repeat-containing protein At3g13880-like [Zingiber officinale]XP_042408409.1 pentatricopeptide repeat-containing protein At3g13880-like [Zingiber officinale]
MRWGPPERDLGARRLPLPGQTPRLRAPNHSPPRLSLPLRHPSAYRHLLQLAAGTQSLILCRLLHSHMVRAGYKPGLFTHNILLNAYCRCCDMATAHQLFDRMPLRDAVSWNILSAGFSRAGYSGAALGVFREARSAVALLDRFSYVGALSACADLGYVKVGRAVHGMVVVNGLARRAFITNSLIDFYSNFGVINKVRLVFDGAEELDEVSWNSLLTAYVRIGWPEVAANILVWMHRSGVKLNSFALSAILKACTDMKDSQDSEDVRRMLHGCVTKVGLDLDLFVGSAMLDVYAKNGGLEEAIKVFECIPNPSVVVFNAMIAGFSRLGTESCGKYRVEALRLFRKMLRRHIKPSKFTFKSVLEACISLGALKCGRQIHAHVIMNNLQNDDFIGSALVTLYSTSHLMIESFRCFEMTSKQEIFTWDCMISAYTYNDHFEKALSLFKELLYLSKEPHQFTLSCVINACSNSGMLRVGEQIHGCSMKLGYDKFTVCGNSIVEMYTKLGELDASIKTFQDLGSLDSFSWSAMISSYGIHGNAGDALMLFEKMKECRVMPNASSFLAVLTACCHGGLLDEGFRYYESMSMEYGLSPNSRHCACLVDLLGRAGRIVDAEDFISKSGYATDPLLWRVIMRACLFYGETEQGIRVGERLMMMEPFSSSSYILLYNMYLDAGKVSLAMRTRGLMRERGVNKETGMSWIEIGASVYSFMSNNSQQPHMDIIYGKLEEIMIHIRQKMGDAGLKILKLEYQSEMWKKSLVNSHGELLALAFGLCKLPKSVPIRVMKNQRVCGDCHTTMKLFSELERRDIVVRDPVRFHHFSWGSCTCGDYW